MTTTVVSRGETPIAAIDRMSLVLDAFDGKTPLTMVQIVHRTGLPRSSVHRMLERLVHLRWLRREGFDYELGTRLVELGSLALHQGRIHQAALPLLRSLQRATGLVVHLAVLDGSDVICLERIGDQLSDLVHTSVGNRVPAHCTAVGKAILAESDCTDVDFTAQQTRFSITGAQQLTTELTKTRERGVAFDREESLLGIGCVAAAIGLPGQPLAAVSVCGPIDRITLDQRLAAPVRITASRIWRNIEFGPHHRTSQPLQAIPHPSLRRVAPPRPMSVPRV
ncbi:IclR family transcriptional regulator [Mycolicibacterium mucogenicum]|uniref:IclR family transcriptional regulator n=1 Tax=Mycolicibacterium mucogenicum TaxID=56689 RepID=UPI00226A5F85|nr:IclR family transcriptional regulator [Mycolicibacterium mucogenicum]MCX8560518.1 IclR family transcriptional regulator [Mycolicibacterium mucogenicum]